MKRTFRYILLTVATLVPVLASAQSGTDLPDPDIYDGYKLTGGVATKKTVGNPDSNGLYTITLETFATGSTTIINKAIPSDIILMLDYSSSMLMSGSAQPNSASATRTRLYELKSAVGEFVNMMKDNNTEIGLSGNDGNRIAFILYAGEVYDPSKPDHQTTTSGGGTRGIFFAQHVNEWLPVSDLSVENIMEHHPVWTNGSSGHDYNSASVIYNDGEKEIDILSPKSQRPEDNHNWGYNSISGNIDIGDVNKSTNSGAAMDVASDMVTTRLGKTNLNTRNLVVVLFTDGEPSSGNGFSPTIANACISAAHDIKDKDVIIYSIGMLSGSEDSAECKTYLEYTSSDFSKFLPEGNPNNPTAMPATNLSINGNYGPYYFRVSQDYTLSDIFKTIGEASGGSEATIPGETQVVDCVSNSFEVPSTFKASDVVVYTRAVSADGKSWGTAVPMTTEEVDPGNNPPMTVQQPEEDGNIGIALKDGKLTVVGFEYSGDENWVGWRDETTCAGKELVIEFKIQANPDATGGDGTNTNTADSGVYVPTFDDEGHITGYTNVNQYDVPHKDIPINLVIEKTGLRHGESATVQIYMSHQKNVGGKIQYHETTGKPLPEADLDLKPGDDPSDEEHGWSNFTKVILTNLGADGATVTKTLLALDASYVYLLVEDNWGWAYELDDKMLSTSEVETNPFVFNNTEKTDAPKHAEAVSINHFGANPHVQNAKSSKVKTFTTGGGSGN